MRETTVVSVFEIPMLLNFWTPDIYNHWCLRKPSVFCICPLNVMSRSSASTDIKPRSSTCQTSDANKSQRNARMFHKPEQSPMSVMSETGRWRSSFPLHKDLCLHGWTQWKKKETKNPTRPWRYEVSCCNDCFTPSMGKKHTELPSTGCLLGSKID